MCPLLWWHGSLRRSAVSLPVTICASIFLFSACGDTASVRLTASKKQRVPIIRGNAALPGDYPSTGAVLIGALSARSTGLCSGTLIAPAVVLTAAHCVVGVQPSQLYFSLADDVSNTMAVRESMPAGAHQVDWAVPHPHYINTTVLSERHNDIALLFLRQPIDSIRPVSWLAPAEAEQLHNAVDAVMVGYGRRYLYAWDSDSYGIKHYATADIANVGPYELHLGSAVDSPHKCQGDSGGPTFIDIYRNGWLQTVQIGLSSHLEGVSPTCENAAVDTRVDVYDTWIREQMRIFT